VENPSYDLIGVKVSAIQIPQILAQIQTWINTQSYGHYIIVANTHVLMEGRVNADLHQAIEQASMVIPDGMPLIVVGRMRGFSLPKRAYGPDLLLAALADSNAKGWRHYFYGSTPQILAGIQDQIKKHWPQVTIAGMYSPPFRNLTNQEDRVVIERINSVRPDILWVGLGCPKQECWIAEHQHVLDVPVMLGVGQAFDILAGAKAKAPAWMQSHGLEWLFRFMQEPRRLWKRYLIYGSQFIFLASREQIFYWRSRGIKNKAQ
jgi:N-acetylglucosaminyldiphosphoundecaprenol N-acetyl-beta-D-mannosaminyltransferase